MKKITIMLTLLCVAVLAQEKGTFTDTRDGKTYNTVKIGEQTWMAQNLNYKPEKGVARCYNDNEARCEKYGRLYDWATAKTACPKGWHLPNNEDWEKFSITVDGRNSRHIDINKKFNFAIILGGTGYFSGHSDNSTSANFTGVSRGSGWWNATEQAKTNKYDPDKAKCQIESTSSAYNGCDKFTLLSVRCLQD